MTRMMNMQLPLTAFHYKSINIEQGQIIKQYIGKVN